MTSTEGRFNGASVFVLPDGRMDAKNAAIYCGMSVKTMAMKRCDGTGPRYVKRGRIFYFREDLDAWMRDAMKASTAKAGAIRSEAVNGKAA